MARYQSEWGAAISIAQTVAILSRENFYAGQAHETDRAADEAIAQFLLGAFPEYGYRGEEVGLVAQPKDSEDHLWLVDPQDGTTAAGEGFRGSAVSIALLRHGVPVLGVVLAYAAPDGNGDLFAWMEGMAAIERNQQPVSRTWPSSQAIVFLSQHGDQSAEANAETVAPMRFRIIPGIAYRLALVAAGEGDLGVSVNAPTGWDVAGGHALLLGAGGDLFDRAGAPVTYDKTGVPKNRSLQRCFGGHQTLVAAYLNRPWDSWARHSVQPPAAASLSFLSPGKCITDSGLLSRAQGCLLGQLAGDALGSLVEFSSAKQIAAQYPEGPSHLKDGGHWGTLAGQPTDDSEMALALARSLVQQQRYNPEEVASAYARWYGSGPFDVGGTTSTALSPARYALKENGSAAKAAMTAANQDSQANGALMRLSPLGIFAHAMPPETVMELARTDALITHPNPVCQDASAIFAATIAFALQSGADSQSVYQFALDSALKAKISGAVRDRLVAAQERVPSEFDSGKQGWVLVAFQNAFYQLVHANSLAEGIIATVRSGGDTDTNAAIAGALLGAVHGRQGIPQQWMNQIQSCRPIEGLAGVKRPRPAVYWPVDALSLAENLLLAGRA